MSFDEILELASKDILNNFSKKIEVVCNIDGKIHTCLEDGFIEERKVKMFSQEYLNEETCTEAYFLDRNWDSIEFVAIKHNGIFKTVVSKRIENNYVIFTLGNETYEQTKRNKVRNF